LTFASRVHAKVGSECQIRSTRVERQGHRLKTTVAIAAPPVAYCRGGCGRANHEAWRCVAIVEFERQRRRLYRQRLRHDRKWRAKDFGGRGLEPIKLGEGSGFERRREVAIVLMVHEKPLATNP
jgi:hypothetical protein